MQSSEILKLKADIWNKHYAIQESFNEAMNKFEQLTRQKCEEEFELWKKQSRITWVEDEHQATIKKVIEEIEKLNESFRKDNIPQRLSGDEFNDKWEEELKAKLEVKQDA